MQVALALVLLVGSGLMIRTFQALRHVNPGFTNPQDVLTLSLSIPEAQVKEPEAVVRMHQAIMDKIAAIPGVTSVGLTIRGADDRPRPARSDLRRRQDLSAGRAAADPRCSSSSRRAC